MVMKQHRILIAIWALLTLCVTFLDVELIQSEASFIFSAVQGFLIVAGTGVFLIALFTKRFKSSLHALILLAALGTAVVAGGFFNEMKSQESMRRGDQIVEALNLFRREQGAYPDRLTDLAPVYMNEIPVTAMAFIQEIPFRYTLKADNGFALEFPAQYWTICSYSSTDGRWLRVD